MNNLRPLNWRHVLFTGASPAMPHDCIQRETDQQLVEVDAAYLEREGDEWVSYVGLDELFQIPMQTAVGILKGA